MHSEVNEALPPEEQFAWWERNSWGVVDKYEELFPHSYLPLVWRGSLFLFISWWILVAISMLRGFHWPSHP